MQNVNRAAVSTGTGAGKVRVVRGVIRGLLHRRWAGGDRLTEEEAAGVFHVSRTPVREALVELASLGIVELRRNCGAIFLPFGERELSDIYSVRSLLEVEAARLAATRMEAKRVVELRKQFEMLRSAPLPDKDWKLDRALHGAIAEAAGNPRLAGEIERYGDLVQTMREAVGRVLAGIHSTSVEEHLRILRCIERREGGAAAEAMRVHLAQAAESAVAAFRRRAKLRA